MKITRNIRKQSRKLFFYLTFVLILNTLFISCFINNDHIMVYQIEDSKYVLKNGISIISAAPGSSTNIVTKQTPYSLLIDINKDNKKDIIAILTQETGGSGVFYYLAVTLTSSSGLDTINAVFIGDRIKIKRIQFQQNQIIVEYFDRSVNLPFSVKPTIYKSAKYTIINNELIEASKI